MPLLRSVALLALAALAPVGLCADPATPLTGDLAQWKVEQMPGGRVRTEGGALIIEDAAGCTAWFRTALTAPAPTAPPPAPQPPSP